MQYLSSSECFIENIKSCFSIYLFPQVMTLHFSVTVKMEMSSFSNAHCSWKQWFRAQTPGCRLKETHGEDVVSRQCNSQRQSLDVTEHHGWFKYKPRHFTPGKSFSCQRHGVLLLARKLRLSKKKSLYIQSFNFSGEIIPQ